MSTQTGSATLTAIPSSSLAARSLHALTATRASLTPTVLRVALGLVMFPHGAQKLLGWFGGYGFDGTMGFLTGQAGLPTPIAFLVIMIEFFGSLALIAGAFSRVAALGVIAVMVGAVATVHLPNGFFMNWSGAQAGEGFEYHVLAIGIALAVVISGSGLFSIDRAVNRHADNTR
ncbi:MAG TPA: DoxX family protein [Candidatus Krumholzibacteria bacterium]